MVPVLLRNTTFYENPNFGSFILLMLKYFFKIFSAPCLIQIHRGTVFTNFNDFSISIIFESQIKITIVSLRRLHKQHE